MKRVRGAPVVNQRSVSMSFIRHSLLREGESVEVRGRTLGLDVLVRARWRCTAMSSRLT